MERAKNISPSLLGIALGIVLAMSLLTGSAYAEERLTSFSSNGSTISAGAGGVSTQATKSSKASKKTGWAKTKAGKVYYRKGKKITGLQTIGSKRYYFNSKGVLRTADTTVGSTRYYVNENGELLGAKIGGKYYYNTLKRMTSADAYDFETFLQARSIVNDITDKGDSKEVKLHKAFDWVLHKLYGIHRTFDPWQTNWTAIYARDHFNNQGGDCHADGAAFAYLAAALGYEADVCLDAVRVGTGSSHCWAMIGNKVYDPLFAEGKSYAGYYGATGGTYETNPTARYRVPQFDPANASEKSKTVKSLAKSSASGLKKSGSSYCYYQNGKKLKNAWKTVGGKRYYFKANGQAATFSTKVKGVYYVFNKKGVLQKGAKAGARTVKVGKRTYQVDKAGKAVPGWSSDKSRRYDKTGLLLTGVNVIGKEFYAASSSGVYDAEKTAQLNEAAQKGRPAIALRKLLGEPQSTNYAASCNFAGDDGLWTYGNFIVTTARPSGVAELTASIVASYELGADVVEPFESVATIEAA